MKVELDKTKWAASENQEFLQRGWRSRKEQEFPPVTSIVRPNDYDNDLDRGTLEYNPIWRNYSFHKVRIPAGMVVRNCNFAQANPDTVAIIIEGQPSSVTFIECNLSNNRINPTIIMQSCNQSQSFLVEVTDEDGIKREERQLVSGKHSELPPQLVEPANIIKRRAF